IVVEITSPSSERDDTGDKLVEYFSVPTVQHYLIVNPIKKVVVHHARGRGVGDVATHIASSGEIDLTPPGITLPIAELLPEIGEDASRYANDRYRAGTVSLSHTPLSARKKR